MRPPGTGGSRPDFPEGAAVVIGGSGGVGRSICDEFARAGADLVLTFRGNQDAASEEVAGAVVVLASARASYVTGQMLVLDGGYSI